MAAVLFPIKTSGKAANGFWLMANYFPAGAMRQRSGLIEVACVFAGKAVHLGTGSNLKKNKILCLTTENSRTVIAASGRN
jgi:hypothetical protein